MMCSDAPRPDVCGCGAVWCVSHPTVATQVEILLPHFPPVGHTALDAESITTLT